MDIKRRREVAAEDRIILSKISARTIQLLEVMRDHLPSMTMREMMAFERSHEHVFMGQRCPQEICETCEAKFRPHWLRADAVAILRGIEVARHSTWTEVKRELHMTQIQAAKAMRAAVSDGRFLGIIPLDPREYRGEEFDREFARWEKAAAELKAWREQRG